MLEVTPMLEEAGAVLKDGNIATVEDVVDCVVEAEPIRVLVSGTRSADDVIEGKSLELNVFCTAPTLAPLSGIAVAMLETGVVGIPAAASV